MVRPSAASATSDASGAPAAPAGLACTDDTATATTCAPSTHQSKALPQRSMTSSGQPRVAQWPMGRGAWGWGVALGQYPPHIAPQVSAPLQHFVPPLFTPAHHVPYPGVVPASQQGVMPHVGSAAGCPSYNFYNLRTAHSV
jgi:hypothetical protein